MSRNTQPPSQSALQARFNLKAFLAARHMKPDSYPTMDVSLEWPLNLQLKSLTSALGAGSTQTDILADPRVGTHIMVLRASIAVATAVGDEYSIVFRRKVSGAVVTTQDLILTQFDNANGFLVPLIGTANSLTGVQQQGIKPVYCPAGYQVLSLQNSAAGATSTLNWLIAEFPETQPLTSLGGFF